MFVLVDNITNIKQELILKYNANKLFKRLI